ncbi:hypothetical protein HD841_002132 [Sphingomonas melonis]|uniref:Uncharacterized protein n=1 Tax=Sphingomonas melonis TaxID=152682 RepID=A0A7Y9FNT7_9SPHN|nr:hypothetical protein [Sphingomonas melonis]
MRLVLFSGGKQTCTRDPHLRLEGDGRRVAC